MADDTNTAEREAAEQWLRDRYGAYRGHFAWRELEEAFKAGRASLAASAGSEPEPFSHWFTDDPKSFAMPGSGFLLGKEPPKDAINVIPVYTHPSPPEGMAGWKPIATAPEGQMVVVGWLDPEDPETPARHDFDLLEDGCWQKWHDHAEHVEIIGGHGVSYTAPYTCWMPVPPLPASEAKEL